MSDLRTEIDGLISAGDLGSAACLLRELWHQAGGPASAAFVVSRFEKLRDKLPLRSHRLAILRSFTVEPVIPLLRASGFASGIDVTTHVGDFNAYVQEILDESSSLYRFKPDTVLLAVRTADAAPELWRDFADLSPGTLEEVIQRVVSSFEQWLRAFRQRSHAALIVHNLEQPVRPAYGVLDAQIGNSQSAAVRQINERLRQTVAQHQGIYVLDYDALVARYGRVRWRDERKWLTARMPIAAEALVQLSHEWLRYIMPLAGKVAKVLAVDLDNTLWGGVIGEDGMNGIQCGPEYPGAAFQTFQRAMLDLSKRGILLAICSKNNPEDALEALNHHPGMLLRPAHFAAMRINWQDKSQNLREIASELNLGLDSLAFVDDNPAERAQVRAAMPEVVVIDLPKDPLEYAAALKECPIFERLVLSAEDQQRTAMYHAERERSQAEQGFRSKEDFFRFLGQQAEIALVQPGTLARVAQLTQKTNQFNLTTRRYSEQQIAEIASRPNWHVYSITVRDRFGDHGLVGVAICHDEEKVCEIDTFLLSCRVIGRTVETALLSYLAESAAERGMAMLAGWFLSTKKNMPARDFYAQHGFQRTVEREDGSRWSLDLADRRLSCPEWISLRVLMGVR